MGYCAVFLLALASFAVAQQEDIEYRVTALERLVSSITADFPQYFTQDGTSDYLEAADSCYKCDEEVAKLHERISNQTRVISELEKTVETLRLRLEDLTDRVNGTENFIANPGTAFYNYMDEVAQASCSALARTPHWV
ncbi:uncharacterized protein LOC118419860 [Branchiostoma floridae]|uniref:Uncharacterized protein LOC118419860 n=1 Tax=Branchiostoma floridae TaxID=7739 RepID=A0A9J7LIK8_BRAFL|nr:uncharacterized protein LOC118419860 [Branchiostoma floridae]